VKNGPLVRQKTYKENKKKMGEWIPKIKRWIKATVPVIAFFCTALRQKGLIREATFTMSTNYNIEAVKHFTSA
jgi:hypothetical protein